MKNRKHLLGLGLIAVACVAVYVAVQFLLDGSGYTVISKQTSPNQEFIIHEFQSTQDGFGHAPYGQILVLTKGKHANKPEDGHVFFAGYCKLPLRYRWVGNEAVSIQCIDGGRERGPKTLSTTMYGIKVVYAEQ